MRTFFILAVALVLAYFGYMPLWGIYTLMGLSMYTIHKEMLWDKEVW